MPEQRLLSPEIWLRLRRRCGTILEISLTPLGFSVLRLLIGEGAMSEVGPGALMPWWCGQAPGRTSNVWGVLVAPLLLSFGSLEASGKNKISGTCFVQFQEYFLYSFSKIQKQQKTGNWHCGILLVG
jgi:hypothetical protein